MAMGSMGAAGSGSETDKAMQLLELLADPAKSKARLEDFARREKAARDAEADSKRATQEARDATSQAQQVRRDVDQRFADLEQRTAQVASREAALSSRETAVRDGEWHLSNAQRAWDEEQKRREADHDQQVKTDVAALSGMHKLRDDEYKTKKAELDTREVGVALREQQVQAALADAEKAHNDSERLRVMHQSKLDELNKRIAKFSQEVKE